MHFEKMKNKKQKKAQVEDKPKDVTQQRVEPLLKMKRNEKKRDRKMDR